MLWVPDTTKCTLFTILQIFKKIHVQGLLIITEKIRYFGLIMESALNIPESKVADTWHDKAAT